MLSEKIRVIRTLCYEGPREAIEAHLTYELNFPLNGTRKCKGEFTLSSKSTHSFRLLPNESNEEVDE